MRISLRNLSLCKRMFIWLLLALLHSTWAMAQSSTVSGSVRDEQGEPLSGVTVLVKGTTIGAITENDGRYIIRTDRPDVILEFRLIGYEPLTLPANGRTVINVVLNVSAISIDQVVAIGYGTKKKSDLTGAVGSIETGDILARGTGQLMNAIQGQVPGVDVLTTSGRAGQGFKIQIRGQNTIASDKSDPLYVIDGIITDDISFLNPNDVARIDILKDASSSAIYGSRGSNGVVLITTQQGKDVKTNKVNVSYNSSYGIRQIARMPDFQDGPQWWNYRLGAYIGAVTDNNNLTTFTISQNNARAAIASPLGYRRVSNNDYYDWVGNLFKNSTETNHSIDINGRNGTTVYNFGVGYQGEKGSFQGNEYHRTTVRGGFNSEIFKIAKIGLQTNMSYSSNDIGSEGVVRNGLYMNPTLHPYNDAGELVYQPGALVGLEIPEGWNSVTSVVNPFVDMENVENNIRRYNVLVNLFGEINPIKGLTLKTQFSPSMRYRRQGEYYGELSEAQQGKNVNLASIEKSESFNYIWDNSIFYQGQTGDHSYDAIFVYSMEAARMESTEMEGRDLSTPSYHALDKSQDQLTKVIGSAFSKETLLSYIVRLNYGYKSKYLLTASLRFDGSSKLAVGHKWSDFPSAGIAWRMAEEPFIKDRVSWIDNLKLRFSFGYTGNNNVGAYTTQTLASEKYNYGFGDETISYIGLGPSGLANKSLTWERTRELNTGLDFDFLNYRISGTIDIYNKLSNRLLMTRKLPVEIGIPNASMVDNVGEVRNSGIEAGLTTRNIRMRNIDWTTTFTFTHNRNKIVSLYGDDQDDLGNKWFIGRPARQAYQYVYDGVTTAEQAQTEFSKRNNLNEGRARVKDLSGNGTLGPEDRTFTGTPFPRWIGSFTSTLRFYRVDFSFNIYANQGRYVKSSFYENFRDVGGRQKYKLNIDYYIPENVSIAKLPNGVGFPDDTQLTLIPNPDGTIPLPNNGGSWWNTGHDDFQNGWADASYVKIRNISLGYSLPERWIRRVGMSYLRIYMNIHNPFVWTTYEGYDPEWAEAKTTSADGPSSITWQFGINVKF